MYVHTWSPPTTSLSKKKKKKLVEEISNLILFYWISKLLGVLWSGACHDWHKIISFTYLNILASVNCGSKTLDHLVWAYNLFLKGIQQSNTLMRMQLSSVIWVWFMNLFWQMPLVAFSVTHLRLLSFFVHSLMSLNYLIF